MSDPTRLIIEGILDSSGFRQTNGTSFPGWLNTHDAEIRADAKREVTDLLDESILQKNRAIASVRELHRKEDKECATCRDAYGDYVRHPCPTFQALEGEA